MQCSFKQIVEEIVARHHSLLRRELPRITELIDSLSNEYPDNESLKEAQQLFKKVRTKIEAHLKDEETIVFPTGVALEAGEAVPQTDMDLFARLEEMEKEHDGCGNTLDIVSQMIKALAQNELRDQVLSNIDTVQQDLRIHVEKENAQVHPRFIELLGIHALATIKS